MKIRAGRWSYQLTPTDLLWAARMIEGEGGNEEAVLWTMAQRLALVRSSPVGRSFTRLIRAYSQPINPRWARGGEFCGPGGSRHDTDACDVRHLDRRARISSLRVADMRDAYELVRRWSRGEVENNVPKAVHFAEPGIIERGIERGSLARVILTEGNAYASTPASENWPRDYVTIGA